MIEKPVIIKRGSLCKVINEELPEYNKILKFAYKVKDGLCFKTIGKNSGKIIVLKDYNDFIFLPYDGSIMSMIDLAMDTKDDVWLKELYEKLENECEITPESEEV